ncbi:hypothetical protein RJ55_06765 [Drechmeria coniospora]|nr:hypothetical protein RJ55_06765 [Drechmeria coniospora]
MWHTSMGMWHTSMGMWHPSIINGRLMCKGDKIDDQQYSRHTTSYTHDILRSSYRQSRALDNETPVRKSRREQTAAPTWYGVSTAPCASKTILPCAAAVPLRTPADDRCEDFVTNCLRILDDQCHARLWHPMQGAILVPPFEKRLRMRVTVGYKK